MRGARCAYYVRLGMATGESFQRVRFVRLFLMVHAHTGTGSGSLVLAARARQAIKFPILTIYVSYTIGNVWCERVASTAPGRTRAALEMPSLPFYVMHSDEFGLSITLAIWVIFGYHSQQ